MAKELLVSKSDLADKLAEEQGLTKKAAAEAVNFVFEEIADVLAKGGTVDVYKFGKFTVKERGAREGINPLTKEKITIAASKSPAFKASKSLKDAVK